MTVTDKTPVTISGVRAQDGTYNGGTHNGYTGTPSASPYSGGFTYNYAKADGTALSGPPTNAGDYTVTISLADTSTYIGSLSLDFTISKASITIKANDQQANVGNARPTLTYTASGLASGDTLAAEPTLTCDADMNKAGRYTITASGGAVPSGGNYNPVITYVPGTLTVTDPTVHVTSVTLNKTSMALAVGSSERLTATVSPSTPSEQFLNYSWIEFRQLNSSIFGSELPVNFNTFRIAITCPSTNLLFETFHIRKRFSQSLAAHDANLYLSHV